jgi:hypothetical protein
MSRVAPTRVLASLLLLGAGLASAQAPIQGQPQTPIQTQALPAPLRVSGAGAHGGSIAEVSYRNGLLTIAADNSSLNQILREIARQTGMTITGTVSDERVFGDYGPGMPARILASLLDGTGSNMLLRQTATRAPAELILTPRIGGPTPPQASSSAPETGTPVSTFGAAPPNAPTWATRPGAGPGANGAAAPAVDPWQAQQENLMQLKQQQLIQQQQQLHGFSH